MVQLSAIQEKENRIKKSKQNKSIYQNHKEGLFECKLTKSSKKFLKASE